MGRQQVDDINVVGIDGMDFLNVGDPLGDTMFIELDRADDLDQIPGIVEEDGLNLFIVDAADQPLTSRQ